MTAGESIKRLRDALPQDPALYIEEPASSLQAGDVPRVSGSDGKAVIVVRDGLRAVEERERDPEALVLLQLSENASKSIASLDDPVSSMELVDAIPRTPTEFEAAYRRAYRDENLDATSGLADELGFPVSHPTVDVADTVAAMVRNAEPGHLIVIVGHVEAGQVRFPDGSAIGTGDLVRSERAFVIACETANGGIDRLHLTTFRPITSDEVPTLVKAIADAIRAIAKSGDATMEQLLRELQQHVKLSGCSGFGCTAALRTLPEEQG